MNWSYIRGLFDGDGTAAFDCHNEKRNCYGTFSFYSNDRDYLERVSCFINNKLDTVGRFYFASRDNCWQLSYFRRMDVIKIGLQLISGYLCKRNVVIEQIRQNGYSMKLSSIDKDITLSYICGFFDADGSVFISGRGVIRVAFSNKDLTLLSDIRDFFDMKTKIYVMTHNTLPDYQLSTEKRSKVLSILEALKSNCVKRYDKIVDCITQLSKM